MKITTHSFIFENGGRALLDDETVLKKLMYDIVDLARLKALKYTSHRFEPQGLSATLILAESHIAAHTWPELNSGYIVMTSCMRQEQAFITASAELIGKVLRANVRVAKELK